MNQLSLFNATMTTRKDKQSHGLHFLLSFGYSLIFHILFGAVILYSFPVHSLPMDRPLSDYIMVMLPDKTEVVQELEKPEVQLQLLSLAARVFQNRYFLKAMDRARDAHQACVAIADWEQPS